MELQLPAYPTATATSYLTHICDIHHSSRQHRILNPLSGATDWTSNVMDTVRFVTAEPQWELEYIYIFFKAAPTVAGSSRARDWIQAVAAIYATAVEIPDPLTHYTRPGIEPVPL